MADTKVVVYPGSFDPITNGHVNLVERTLCIFDEVIISIARNQDKGGALFSLEERIDMVRDVFRAEGRVRVDTFQGLLVDYAEQDAEKGHQRRSQSLSLLTYRSTFRGLRSLGPCQIHPRIQLRNVR